MKQRDLWLPGCLPPHAEGLSGALLQLGQTSLELIPRWVGQIEVDSGLSCGLRACGIVVPFRSDGERTQYPTARYGLELNRVELEQELPGSAPSWSSGLLFEQDGQIDNRRQLMRALERACVSLGVQFLEGSHVKDIQRDTFGALSGVVMKSAEGDECLLACQQAVLACGAWSHQLIPELNVFPCLLYTSPSPRD